MEAPESIRSEGVEALFVDAVKPVDRLFAGLALELEGPGGDQLLSLERGAETLSELAILVNLLEEVEHVLDALQSVRRCR